MISAKQQNIDFSFGETSMQLKQKILSDQVLMQMLTNYSDMDDEELLKKYTLLISSKKYKQLKIKMANQAWSSAYINI